MDTVSLIRFIKLYNHEVLTFLRTKEMFIDYRKKIKALDAKRENTEIVVRKHFPKADVKGLLATTDGKSSGTMDTEEIAKLLNIEINPLLVEDEDTILFLEKKKKVGPLNFQRRRLQLLYNKTVKL